MPLKRVEKNLYKGTFRRGRKITIEEKLQKFVDKIKPRPPPKKKDDSYLKDLLYWKPPARILVAPKETIIPQSEESMLALLNQKELEYKDEL